MVIKKIKDFIKNTTIKRSKKKNENEFLVEMIKHSGHFDATWYKAKYNDVSESIYWSQNPQEHYLKFGAEEGRDPSPWFNTVWYLSKNSDVKKAGVNPLLHYIQHGIHEGREPSKNVHLDPKVSKQWQIRRRLSAHLWGGLSQHALKKLNEIVENHGVKSSERWLAAWHIARWWYFHGDFEKAMSMADTMDRVYPNNQLIIESVYLKAFCHFYTGYPDKASRILKKYLKINPKSVDALFALSNAYIDDDAKRLALINQALNAYNLSSIEKKNERLPLSISNLCCSTEKRISSETKVSVIIPAFNAEERIKVVLESLINQTWRNIEVIVVDDCSTDSTFEICQHFQSLDGRIVAVRQNENKGAYAARNLALEICTGELITTHDSDDWSHPQKLETQVKFFEANPQKMGMCLHWIRANENMFFTQNWRPNDSLTHWSHSSFMFRKKVYEDLGGWNDVRVGGDTEFIWRMKSFYGDDSYQLSDQKIPFAFALDDDASLTRNKVTHVKTVYFGLRHIYRAACKWTHADYAASNKDFKELVYPSFPQKMTRNNVDTMLADVLLVSDFSDEEMSHHLFEFVDNLAKNRFKVAMFHWPDFNKKPSQLHASYFKALLNDTTFPVVAGEKVKTSLVITANHKLLEFPVDSFPEVIGNNESIVLKGDGYESKFDAFLHNAFGQHARYVLASEATQIISKITDEKEAKQ
ncbi:glycosyltransferase family A protein [Aliiglaciecola sp. M165]|uniref:glycosyltransferase family A protein n=1 Tax=Aliiglaciecola sp. M165 TaxID=2593649 RepID=UPI00117EBC24|nr:glycosyltransferase family A protein [Aliiglaciecola sp. M165]TRY30775.1 glycosyltransferase [Aliiglaciecola sp. M165]